MPPRSKTRHVEFIICELCHCQFSSRDQEKHVDICKVEGGSPCAMSHGFVRERQLHGFVNSLEAAPEHLPKEYQSEVILLHPSTMQICEIPIGGLVIVKDLVNINSAPQIFTAWPHPTGSLTNVHFVQGAPILLSNTERVVVSVFDSPCSIAQEVHVQPREEKAFLYTPDFTKYLQRKFDGKYLTVGNKLCFSFFGQPCHLIVKDVKVNPKMSPNIKIDSELSSTFAGLNISDVDHPYKLFKVCETKFIIAGKEDDKKPNITLNRLQDLGGLDKQIESLKELLDLHFKPRSERQAGLTLPKGILIYGPSGTGKSMLAKALINYTDVHYVSVQGSEVWSRYFGETESRLSAIFQEAKCQAPSIVFIDEIDVLCPRKETSQNEFEKRIVSTILTLIDSTLSASVPVVLIAVTNNREQVNPALRRPGRLDREVEIPVPNASERKEILDKLLTTINHELTVKDIKSIADRAHGYVGADLMTVCREAGLLALKRCSVSEMCIKLEDVVTAMQLVQPSAMREVALEIPMVSWEDIGGQNELKHKLRQAIEWPLKYPDSFARLGVRPPRGLLMYGPPGCSKTMVAKALARESGLNFLAIKGPELFSKWVGESERAVRELFRKARAAAPSIVFFDEIDSIAGERGSGGSGGGEVGDRVLAQLLTEIDGVVALKDVTVVAATNRPDRIDKALLRPGRLDRIVYVPLPDQATRREIFKIQFKKTPVASDVSIDWLVSKTEIYSGAEVTAVCHEAALEAIQEDLNTKEVGHKHFELALQTVTPRISHDLISFYNDYASSSGLHSI